MIEGFRKDGARIAPLREVRRQAEEEEGIRSPDEVRSRVIEMHHFPRFLHAAGRTAYELLQRNE